MFRNLKLSAKMAMGFGALIALCAVMSLVSWRGVNRISRNVDLASQGAQSVRQLDDCAKFRRDFAIGGFDKQADGKNAVENWQNAYSNLMNELGQLAGASGLDEAKRTMVRSAQSQAPNYKTAFDAQVEAYRVKQEAFAGWSKVGGKVTEEIQGLFGKVIAPTLARAEESKDLAEYAKWSRISKSLDDQFVQNFLLLRVTAIYLIATNKDEQAAAYDKQLAKTREATQQWAQSVKDNDSLSQVATNLKKLLDEYEAAGKQYVSGIAAERSSTAQMATVAAGVVDTMQRLDSSLRDDMEAAAASTKRLNLAVVLGVLVLGVVLASLITRSIVKPINRIIAGLNEGAEQVSEAAGQVASASQQLAEGASEQAASLEETSSALQEVSAMTRTNAGNAKQANELSTQASQAASNGDRTVGELNKAMAAISDSSEKISKIIKVIEEIAFQTNLLALNAAVEAARAGEHGKGFAVVADEVRNLAQRAAQAARETTGLIEDSVRRVKEGTQVAEDVGKSLGAIVSDVTKVTELIDGIATASEEQAQGVDQVSTAVTQMDQVTQQNASAAEESASASEELAGQAEAVKGMVNELVTLVGGSRAAAAVVTRQASKSARKKKVTAAPKPQVQHVTPARLPTPPTAMELESGEGSELKSF